MPAAQDIDRAYAEILESWIQDAEQNRDDIYAFHVRLRKHLYQKSYALNDFKTCLAIAGDLEKLQSAYAERRAKARKPYEDVDFITQLDLDKLHGR